MPFRDLKRDKKRQKEQTPKRRTMKQKQQSWVMTGLKALKVIAMLATLIFAQPGLDWSSPIDHFETFAGKMSAGRTAVPFELDLDPKTQDILTPHGFANACFQVLRLRVGGADLHAPVCSTWVWMSRGSTLRSACRPLGRSDSKKVHEGNVMTARVMVLMILAACKGCWSILEQPQSSLMSCHPTFQRMLKLLRIFKVTVKMCDYGGSTDKPLTLFSKIADILEERQPSKRASGECPEMTVKYIDGSGKQRCKGGADLKASQHYPPLFGKCLAKVRSKHLKKVRSQARQFLRRAAQEGGELDDRMGTNAHWLKHADLYPVLSYLTNNAVDN
ncbi:unnamed protein product [Cladocopium goreaui]|uniref:Uncharacterized protein n=1 Tax=Cladocopium goreaui TaxID=2562237 RepID=A0A9P1G634_9DINO|nr:unnamed protein product [Cladocopium goreaui]